MAFTVFREMPEDNSPLAFHSLSAFCVVKMHCCINYFGIHTFFKAPAPNVASPDFV